MTGESEEKTKPWVEKHGVEYAFGYMTKEAMSPFMSALGMRGYPSAALVNPKGEVVWTGHPASIQGSLIKKHLKGADKTPVDVRAVTKRWPPEAKPVKSLVASNKFAKALEIAKGLPEEWNVAADVQRAIDRKVKGLEALHSAGELLEFTEGMKEASKSLAGLPELDSLKETLAELNKDPEAKKVVSGLKKFAKMAADANELRKSKDADKLVGKLQKLAKKYGGTIVSTKASGLANEIEKRWARRR